MPEQRPEVVGEAPAEDTAELRLEIRSEHDILAARTQARHLAARQGFSAGDQALVATAVSELARNIVQYAKVGEVVLAPVEDRGRRGVRVVASDCGPGIADIALALQDGFSTGGGLGLGLPGARRLVDQFEIESTVGKGTVVRLKKWV